MFRSSSVRIVTLSKTSALYRIRSSMAVSLSNAEDFSPLDLFTSILRKLATKEFASEIERLHVTSQTLRNHFRVAKEVCQHTHSTRSVVGVDATKYVRLPISSEPTGTTMD